MPQPENYVFPAGVRHELSDAVAVILQQYLLGGSPTYELLGLNEAPQFVLSVGSGAPGDETQYTKAQVLFPDDENPGAPHVRIAQVHPTGSPRDWGDDQEIWPFNFAVDCRASEYTGALTAAQDPFGADSILSDAVMNLLSHWDAMCEVGFVAVEVTPGALGISGVDFHIPISVACEVYVAKS